LQEIWRCTCLPCVFHWWS